MMAKILLVEDSRHLRTACRRVLTEATKRKMKEREKVTTVFHADMVLRNGECAGLDPTHDLPVCTLEQFSCLDDR
jgi:hypothetical protein